MAKATGIGGIFFRARDAKALAAWYREHLGITEPPWYTQAGVTAFQPFRHDTDYFPADRQVMINLRVDDLAARTAELYAKGIAVETRAEWDTMPEIGRFARIVDPEGNHIELWERAGPAGS